MKKILSLLFAGICLTGCTPEWDFGSVDFTPQLVVEGWIEENSYANVCLTQSLTLDTNGEEQPLFDIPIRWAKVTVSNGEESEILTGRINHNYTPPFLYTGAKLKGEAGKTYTLTIEYSEKTLTASTTIPPTVPIDRISVSRCDDSDSLYQIKVDFRDDRKEKNYYKLFTRAIPDDKRFFSSFMGTFDDEVLPTSGKASVQAHRGIRYTHIDTYTPFFKERDTVMVKLTQLPKDGFEFWSDYENEVTNGKNPIFPSSSNLSSNIKGGLGIWCGYGADIRIVCIKDSI